MALIIYELKRYRLYGLRFSKDYMYYIVISVSVLNRGEYFDKIKYKKLMATICSTMIILYLLCAGIE